MQKRLHARFGLAVCLVLCFAEAAYAQVQLDVERWSQKDELAVVLFTLSSKAATSTRVQVSCIAFRERDWVAVDTQIFDLFARETRKGEIRIRVGGEHITNVQCRARE